MKSDTEASISNKAIIQTSKEEEMKKVFISYKHSDRAYVDQVKSVADNPNNSLEFYDHSLAEAILNDHGHVNRRPPSDSRSESVKTEIEKLLKQSDKLVVIIGNDTHSSEWVKWEMSTYSVYRGKGNILMMRHKNSSGGAPSGYKKQDIKDWDFQYLDDWINS